MRRLHVTILIHLSIGFITPAFSQGCSDAGFCTMGAMRPDQAYSKRVDLRLRSLELNYYRGKSLLSPVIYVTSESASRKRSDDMRANTVTE